MQNELGIQDIKSGMIVAYKAPGDNHAGWYRVTKATKNYVNLGAVFGGRVYYKSVPKAEVKEDEQAWYDSWSKSETYMSM
jgi:hypothetical protein